MIKSAVTALAAGACLWLVGADLALAGPWDGLYAQGAECGTVGSPGGALEIREGVFYGQGLACRMTRPVDVLDMDATLYTMECTDGSVGPDARWSERMMMMRDADGESIVTVWNGYSFRYEACAAQVLPSS